MNIGCDIVKNERLNNKNKSFVEKILTNKEIELYDSHSNSEKILFLSGRFAAKEAIIKALNGNINMQDISILKNKNGSPIVITEKPFNIRVSISHEKDYTVALAMVD